MNISQMYRAVLLPKTRDPERPIVDYRMMRFTFGVSASLFTANMVMKQNTLENMDTHPHAVQAVLDSCWQRANWC